MYGVVFQSSHHGPRYLDVTFSNICFLTPLPPIVANLMVPKITSDSGNIVPNKSRQAGSLPVSFTWLTAEDEEMISMIGCTNL